MPRVQILSDTLASQVAAGEVVERPASVVKELVENSIDAGATHIKVEMQRGGVALIRVTDDGCGMGKEDALLSLERHATSKLRTSEELSVILTLGFRGEAVPSIASVSKFRLLTREKGSVSGTEIIVTGGKLHDVREAGVAEGTSVEVKQIFFNVPARRKFLRAETTESAHVEHQVKLHALASPEVRFTLIKDGRTLLDLPATEDWRMRIAGIAGREAAGSLIAIEEESGNGFQLSGYLLPAEFARKGRKQQYVFLNGRPVEDAAISYGLREGFRGGLQEGNHPSAWLKIEMEPSLVDVNVHPAKREVRFHRPSELKQAIVVAVESALRQKAVESRPVIPVPGISVVEAEEGLLSPDKSGNAREQNSVTTDFHSSQLPQPRAVSVHRDKNEFLSLPDRQIELPEPAEKQVKNHGFELIGPLHDRYIVMQGEAGVVLLDPVAARERVIYERLLAGVDKGGVNAQGLLVPELLELDAIDAEFVLRHEQHFQDAGMGVANFGGSTVQVSSVPDFVKLSDVRSFLLGLVDELQQAQGSRRSKKIAYEQFATSLARKSSLGEPCTIINAEKLLESLFQCDLPYCAADGRPTVIHISLNELDRKFGK